MNSPLSIMKQFFDMVEKEDIRYCVWKGSEHLGESLSGKSDLDLLVEQSQAARFEQILVELAFKRFISQPWASFPGIEDWFGFDSETGQLVHIHLYSQLLVGTKFVHEYHLPWEKRILDSTVKDPSFKVLIADPNLEIVILCARLGLINSLSDLISVVPGQRSLEKDFKEKFDYLADRIDKDSVLEHARCIFGNDFGQQIGTIITQDEIKDKEVNLHFKAIIKRALAQYRRYSRAKVVGIFTFRTLHFLYARAIREFRMNYHTGKRMQNEGAVIAIIGSDGSGKSTITHELQQWLAWKIDAHKIYLGSGDGPVDLPVRLLQFLASISSRKKANFKTKGTNRGSSNGSRKSSFIKEVVSCLLDLSITNQRYRKVNEAHQARRRGSILITDRYPQNQFVGIYDGPRVARKNAESGLRKFFSRLEEQKYQEISKISPDIVYKLHVPLNVALQRKPDHNAENIQRKAEITSKLGFSESKVIDIDASKPVVDVLNSVKKSVWESI